MAERVGVVGLGAMGGAMARNLLRAGLPTAGTDVDEGRRTAFAAAGGVAVATTRELAGRVEVAILSLPSVAAFETVVGELEAGARDGLVVLEMSTLPVDAKVRGRDALARVGATLLDCPLSGTGDQAVSRDLVVLASGDAEAVEGCADVLDAIARSRHHLGDFGTGTQVKLIANLLVAVHNVAAAEALSLARSAGLDLEQVLEVVSDGAGASRMLEQRGPKMVAGDYSSGVRTTVFLKDLGLIAGFAEEHRVATPLLDACRALYERSAAEGHADEDTASVHELLRALRRG